MQHNIRRAWFPLLILLSGAAVLCPAQTMAQRQQVLLTRQGSGIDISIDGNPFTQFIFSDTLEKPVLYPVHASNGVIVTRGFPLAPRPGEPTDHPHHIGIWFNFENVNGLDFWNNSYAIAAEKKSLYGWIKTDTAVKFASGRVGTLDYHARWTNQQNETQLDENTHLEFSGEPGKRIIDRVTTLTAKKQVLLKDAKDGLYAIRVARELQIPEHNDKSFTDNKGNITSVKADTVSNGNYITSIGKTGDSAWSTRASWCKLYGKLEQDSVSIVIFDHQSNLNFPTYWHARGYGLFSANPLGAAIFSNGRNATNLTLQPGQTVTFRYRILIQNGSNTISPGALNAMSRLYSSSK